MGVIVSSYHRELHVASPIERIGFHVQFIYDSAFATRWASQWWASRNLAEKNRQNRTKFGNLLTHQFFPEISLHNPSLELVLNSLYWPFTSNFELSGIWAALT